MKFRKRFLTLLEMDVSLSSLAPYQRLGTRGVNRKNQRQVPEYRRTDPTKNSKVEMVRDDNTKRVLAPSDVKYILNKYNIAEVPAGGSKELGTSGMIIQRSVSNVYTLTR